MNSKKSSFELKNTKTNEIARLSPFEMGIIDEALGQHEHITIGEFTDKKIVLKMADECIGYETAKNKIREKLWKITD